MPVIPTNLSQRGAGLGLAIAIELLIILLLMSLGFGHSEPEPETVAISSFDVGEPAPESPPRQAEEMPEPESSSSKERPEPVAEAPVLPAIAPLPSALPIPVTRPTPQPGPAPSPMPSPTSSIGAVVRSDSNFGPADTGSSRGPDSQRVGTAPDGSPLYAARWYREPDDGQLAGYLSTANSAGWGLIACKTAPNWRVEDCVALDEYPSGSGIARAVQAAAWQFQVRPPRLRGEYQVGSWVRIRIDYTRSQRRPGY